MELVEKSIKKSSTQSIKKSLEESAKKRVRKAAQRHVRRSSQKKPKKPNIMNRRLIQSDDSGLSKESLALDIVLMNDLQSFGHPEICACAVNKRYYEFLHAFAPERKKCLISFDPRLKSSSSSENLSQTPSSSVSFENKATSPDPDGAIYWNKNGSACGQISKDTQDTFKLCYWFIADGKSHYYESINVDFFDLALLELPKLRFCSNGDLCCYGWNKDQFDTVLWGTTMQLVECSLSQQGIAYARRCGIDIGEGNIRSLALFKSSILLEAFLNSSVGRQTDMAKIYTLKDARIPLDCISDQVSLEDELTGLPQDIKEAVRKHYLAQHKKPINKIM